MSRVNISAKSLPGAMDNMSCTMSRLYLLIKSLPEVLEDINVPAGTGDGVK